MSWHCMCFNGICLQKHIIFDCMMPDIFINRTVTEDRDFQMLIQSLDHELWNELQEDQATYDQYNKVPHIKTAVLVYADNAAVACGCFKQWDDQTVEIKRMFVEKAYRGKGISRQVLSELERWAIELGYQFAVLETSVHFATARKLYQTSGYYVTDNYPPYEGLQDSVCMRKQLRPHA